MNKVSRLSVICMVIALVALSAVGFAHAQDATATTDTGTTATRTMVQCDSDLILNLYIAEHFFGFDRVNDQLMSNTANANAGSMLDLNTIDRGQYAPWFSAPMAAPNTTVTDQQITDISNFLAMDDATLQSTMAAASANSNTTGAAMTTLPASSMAGESTECAQLRTELSRFFNVLAFEDVSMGGLGMNSTGTTTGTTAEQTPMVSPEETATPTG